MQIISVNEVREWFAHYLEVKINCQLGGDEAYRGMGTFKLLLLLITKPYAHWNSRISLIRGGRYHQLTVTIPWSAWVLKGWSIDSEEAHPQKRISSPSLSDKSEIIRFGMITGVRRLSLAPIVMV